MNIQDHKLVKMQATLSIAPEDTNPDLEPLFVQALGVAITQAHTQDMWHEFWDEEGIASGQYNDRAYAWLATVGYLEPHIQDRWYSFWSDVGPILGAELVIDGGFDNPADWTLGSGWSIAASVATTDGTAATMSQTVTPIPGETYQVLIDTAGAYVGGLSVELGGTASVVAVDASHNLTIVAGAGTDLVFNVPALNDFIGNVDNVSVRRVYG